MSKVSWNLLKAAPMVLGASILAGQSAIAAPTESVEAKKTENVTFSQNLLAQAVPQNPAATPDQDVLNQINRYSNKRFDSGIYNNPMSQVTSVNQLRDVEPTAWAFEALRSLVERYGCIVGYPDRTFRGNRALTRWEFAAGLNACLNVIERLIQEGVGVLREDIDKLKRLAQEFESELAALGARVDNLEQRVAFLEDHQFSTTTKLKGEVIFSIADTFGDSAGQVVILEDPNEDNIGDLVIDEDDEVSIIIDDDELILDNDDEILVDDDGTVTIINDGNEVIIDDEDDIDEIRVFRRGDRDDSETVFQDRVRLNFETSFTGKDLLRTRLQAGNFGGNRFDAGGVTATNMTRLAYDDGTNNDVTIDDLFYRTSLGPVTLWVGTNGLNLDDVFDTTNPYLSDSGTGALSRGQRYNNLVYRGPSGAGAALKLGNDFINFTATYLASEAANPVEGSGLFNGNYSAGAQLGLNFKDVFKIAATYVHTYAQDEDLFGGITSLDTERPFFFDSPMTAERFGLQASLRPFPFLNLAAWGGYAFVKDESGIFDDQDVWTWNANVSLVDVLIEGSLLWVGGGMPPKAENENGTSYMIETGFRIPVTKNIFLSPGAYVVFDPNHEGRNDTIYVGVLRTTFKF